jgi:hypothetical protein
MEAVGVSSDELEVVSDLFVEEVSGEVVLLFGSDNLQVWNNE